MTEPIIKEIMVNAPIAKVWKALSTKEDLAKWFHASGDFELEAGHTFHMDVQHEGKDYKHTLTITEIIPEQKLALDWFINGDPGITHVEYELEPEGCKTKVKVTHSGFDKYGEAGAETRSGYNGGWDHVLNKLLKEFVEN
ncbi:MAG: SRPBCC domain-containing protein [Bacteroidetes bacterium]|nr:SRPBCC domain-containing protein [Bacteroidota bacterium]